MELIKRQIDYFQTVEGRFPYAEWRHELRDKKTKAVIDTRLARLRVGNFGNCAPVGEGVLELKIDYGPGYRVYFGQVGERIVLLLLGGDKSTQKKDIRQAQEFWRDYRVRYL